MKYLLLICLMLVLSCSGLFAATPRVYNQKLTDPNSVLVNQQFPDVTCPSTQTAPGYVVNTWITVRPAEVFSTLTHSPAQIRLYRFGNGTSVPYQTRFLAQFGNFTTQWVAGDTIHVQIINNNVSPAKEDFWEFTIPPGTAPITITTPVEMELWYPSTLIVNGPVGYEVLGPVAGTTPYQATRTLPSGLFGDYTISAAPDGFRWQQNPITVTADMFADSTHTSSIEFELIPNMTYPASNPLPADNASLDINSAQGVQLSWDAIPNAAGYKLFWNGATEHLDLSTAQWTTPLLADGAYTWQVVPYNVWGDAADCPVWHFNVLNYTVNPAINPNPAEGSIIAWTSSTPLNLSWSAPTTGGTPAGYKLVFNGQAPIDLGNVLSWQTTPLDRGDFTWQIIPYIGTVEAVACPQWSFSVQAPLLYTVYNPDFGDVWINHQVSRTFLISNGGNATMDCSVLFTQGAFTLNPAPGQYQLLPQQSMEFTVSFLPTALQSYSRNLYIETNDPDSATLLISLTGTGYNLTADFVATPQSGLIPLNVEFAAITQPSHQAWHWDFGDMHTGDGAIISHEYPSAGEWLATLTVTDSWGFTNSCAQTITANAWAAISADIDELIFMDTYLGTSGSSYIRISNTGPGLLNVSSVNLKNNNAAFPLPNAVQLVSINPGSFFDLEVAFAPVAEGVAVDSLLIFSDAVNNGRLAIKLQGRGLYVPPATPTNVSLAVDYPDVVLTWDVVSQSIFGSPVTVPYYFIYGSKYPNATAEDQFFLGYSYGTSFRHQGVGLPGSNIQPPREYFYTVCAVLYYPPRDLAVDLDALAGRVTRKELLSRLGY